MSALHTLTATFADCNLHFCLYGAFGAHLLQRALLALRDRRYDDAREHMTHGAVYVTLGLL